MITPEEMEKDLIYLTEYIGGEMAKELGPPPGSDIIGLMLKEIHTGKVARYTKINQLILDDMADALHYNIHLEQIRLCSLEAQPKSVQRAKDIEQAKRDIELYSFHLSNFLS